ncbi:hypothetical protein Tco_1022002 [Tanacetum coccineum]
MHILDYEGLTPDMRQDLAERLRMVYTRDDGQEARLGVEEQCRLSGGHFIRRLAHHFGLVSDDGLRGLSVMTRELPLIDMVAATAGPGGVEDALDVDEGA